MSNKIYMALCAIAIGKQIIPVGKPLPADVSPAKIKSLLENGSIEVREVEVPGELTTQSTAPKAPTVETIAAQVTGDGSGSAAPDLSQSEKQADGIDSEQAPIIKRAVSKDDRVVELNALSVAALKKVATELQINGSAQMKKEALVEAITATEFAAPAEE